jgi:hypothetical protein
VAKEWMLENPAKTKHPSQPHIHSIDIESTQLVVVMVV